MTASEARVQQWLAALEARHLADLTFSEVSRALRALSSTYVERRARLSARGALDSRGKRAAYALYYSPLHFLTVSRIVEALDAGRMPLTSLLDLGCGAGAASAAWAMQTTAPPRIMAIDTHPWAVEEAAFTYRTLGLAAEVRRAHAARVPVPRSTSAIVAAWMLNELDATSRDAVRHTLLAACDVGARILVVEPIATRVSPWWDEWVRPFGRFNTRTDLWRFQTDLPDLLKRLDRATGMRHDELTARSLYAGG
jgi:hypothetical protein